MHIELDFEHVRAEVVDAEQRVRVSPYVGMMLSAQDGTLLEAEIQADGSIVWVSPCEREVYDDPEPVLSKDGWRLNAGWSSKELDSAHSMH